MRKITRGMSIILALILFISTAAPVQAAEYAPENSVVQTENTSSDDGVIGEDSKDEEGSIEEEKEESLSESVDENQVVECEEEENGELINQDQNNEEIAEDINDNDAVEIEIDKIDQPSGKDDLLSDYEEEYSIEELKKSYIKNKNTGVSSYNNVWVGSDEASRIEQSSSDYFYSLYNQLKPASQKIYEGFCNNYEHFLDDPDYKLEVRVEKSLYQDGETASDMILPAVAAFNLDTMDAFWLDTNKLKITTATYLKTGDHLYTFFLHDGWSKDKKTGEEIYNPSKDYKDYLNASYQGDWEKVLADKEKMLQSQEKILDLIEEQPKDDLSKRLAVINDFLVNNNYYNRYVRRGISTDPVEAVKKAWTPAAALIAHSPLNGNDYGDPFSPVCEGYARAFKMICEKIGVPCILVVGKNHMWNYVQDTGTGKWYAVDATWNDPIGSNEKEYEEENRQECMYNYFMVGANTPCPYTPFISTHPDNNCSMWSYTEGEGENEKVIYGDPYVVPILADEKYEYIEKYLLTLYRNADDEDDTPYDTITIYEGQPYGELPTPERTGYEFVGWYTDKDITIGTEVTEETVCEGDAEIYAIWKALEFTVSFSVGEDAPAVDDITVTYGQPYGELPTPEAQEGYIFEGWYTAETDGVKIEPESIVDILENITLYAKWVEGTSGRILTFDVNDGNALKANTKKVFLDKPYGILPTPERYGYSFVGWCTSKDSEEGEMVDEATVCTDDAVLYAIWELKTVSVVLDAGKERHEFDVIEVVYSEPYGELPTPEALEGYVFAGWFTSEEGGEPVTADTIVTNAETHTLYAHWAERGILVALVPDMGTVEPSVLNVKLNEPYGKLPIPNLEEEDDANFIFDGWYVVSTNEEGEEEPTLVTEKTIVINPEDHTLYGRFTERPQLPAPYADPAPGEEEPVELEEGMAVVLMCSTPGASVYYAMNGEEPIGENGILYTEPIRFTKELLDSFEGGEITIQAIAMMDGYKNSEIVSFTYTKRDESDFWGDIDDDVKEAEGFESGLAVPNGLWISGMEDKLYTGGAITFPGLHVYFGKTLLKANKDYTIKYVNNKKVGKASVTITGKGNYSGKAVAYFNILPLDLNSEELDVVVGDITLKKNGKIQKGVPVVTAMLNGKRIALKNGTDFILKYPGTSPKDEEYDPDNIPFKDPGDYDGQIVGTGNFTSGENPLRFTESIIEEGKPVSKLSISVAAAYTDQDIEELKITVKDGAKKLRRGEDYTVGDANFETPGTGYVFIEGDGEKYVGSKMVTFKVNTRKPKTIAITKAKFDGIKDRARFVYGEVVQPEDIRVYMAGDSEDDGEELTLDEHYTITYQNTNKKGTGYITVKGIGEYSGSKKFKVTILPFDMSKDEDGRISAAFADEATFFYQKGGTTPEVIVTDGDNTLVKGKDYTLTYVGNAKLYDDELDNAATVIITGKGNYKGTYQEALTFEVGASSLDYVSISAQDVAAKSTAGINNPAIKLVDSNGKELKVGTDYYSDYSYSYASSVVVQALTENGYEPVERSLDDEVLSTDIVPVGTPITATVTGKGFYEDTTKAVTFHVMSKSIAKATVKVAAQTFTGKQIKPGKADILEVSIGSGKSKVVLNPADYEIVGYGANLAKGNGTLTIHGIGQYGGIKKATFKIVQKTINYRIVYDKNAETATGTMKDSVLAAGGKLTAAAFKRLGYNFVGWNTERDGSGASYKNKGKFEQKVEGRQVFGHKVTLYAQWEKKDNLTAVTATEVEYKEALAYLKTPAETTFNKVVCIGDSLTEGVQSGPAKDVWEVNYPAEIAKLTGAEVINRGTGGASINSADVGGAALLAAQIGIEEDSDADAVFFMAGTADYYAGAACELEAFAVDFDTVLNSLESSFGAEKVFVILPMPVNYNVSGNWTFNEMRETEREIANSHGMKIIDFAARKVMLGTDKDTRAKYYSGADGVHPNDAGYKVLGAIIASSARKILNGEAGEPEDDYPDDDWE